LEKGKRKVTLTYATAMLGKFPVIFDIVQQVMVRGLAARKKGPVRWSREGIKWSVMVKILPGVFNL